MAVDIAFVVQQTQIVGTQSECTKDAPILLCLFLGLLAVLDRDWPKRP